MIQKYSKKTLNQLAKFIDQFFSHTEIDSLLFGASVPDEFDHGNNKLQRILNALKNLSSSTDTTHIKSLNELFNDAIISRKNLFDPDFECDQVMPLALSLKADGYEIIDGTIIPIDSLESELTEEINILYERLQLYSMTEVCRYLDQAHQNFIDGNNESCNAVLRTALESTLYEIAHHLTDAPDHITRANNKYLTPADIRKHLEKIGFFNKQEMSYIKEFYGYASTNGSHPGISSQTDSRLRRLMIVALIQYSLEKLMTKKSVL